MVLLSKERCAYKGRIYRQDKTRQMAQWLAVQAIRDRSRLCFLSSSEALYPSSPSDSLFVKGFDLRQLTPSLGCLRQMETKSVTIGLYTEQACSGRNQTS